MPYSKDPHRYPQEMLQLLHLLAKDKSGAQEYKLRCEHQSEANGRRVMVQSFFAAVQRHAQELEEKLIILRARASTTAERKDRAAHDAQEEYRQAKALAELWAERAYEAKKWMVRVDPHLPGIVISRRGLEGTFRESLKGLFAEVEGQATGTVPTGAQVVGGNAPAPGTEAYMAQQMALLRQATAELEARQREAAGGDSNAAGVASTD